MSGEWIFNLYVFVLATFVGYQVISRVPPLLHTPLMSGTNAISGISLVGVAHRRRSQPPPEPDPRLRRRHLRHHQRRRRLPHHRPHAAHVPAQARRPPRTAPSRQGGQAVTPTAVLLSLSYLVAAVLFILCLRGLSGPQTRAPRPPPRRAGHAHRRRGHAPPQARSSATSGSSAGCSWAAPSASPSARPSR